MNPKGANDRQSATLTLPAEITCCSLSVPVVVVPDEQAESTTPTTRRPAMSLPPRPNLDPRNVVPPTPRLDVDAVRARRTPWLVSDRRLCTPGGSGPPPP